MWKISFDCKDKFFNIEKLIRSDEELISTACHHISLNNIFDAGKEIICLHIYRAKDSKKPMMTISYALSFIGFRNGQETRCCVGLLEKGNEIKLKDIYPSFAGFSSDEVQCHYTQKLSEFVLGQAL
ncbi:MAG: hypothetical protein AAF349_12710 [Cyanobacteria bacterium P01_A01_bin.68]